MQQERLVFTGRDYLSRSWRMLTRTPGWIKPVLLLTLIMFIPIVGPLIVLGYTLEWARLTAWGVDSSPKQTGIAYGTCLSVGWRAILVTLCWAIPTGILVGVLRGIAGEGSIGQAVGFLGSILSFLVGVVALAAALRATIYQQFGAGIGFGRVFEMVESDYKGILRVTGILIFGHLVVAVVSGIIMMVGSVGAVPALMKVTEGLGSDLDPKAMGEVLGTLLASLGPAFAITMLVDGFISTLFSLVGTNAMGLWMLQFDVPKWGDKDAPLPACIPPAPVTWDAPAQPVVPAAPLLPNQTVRPTQQLPQSQPGEQGQAPQKPSDGNVG